MSLRIALGTACGEKKLDVPAPMHQLYKSSSRIKSVYCRRNGFPLYILSAEYGLVHSDEIRAPYDRRMTLQRAKELAPVVADVLNQLDWFVFYNLRTPLEYGDCIARASQLCGTKIAVIGKGIRGRVDECLLVAKSLLETGRLPDIHIETFKTYG